MKDTHPAILPVANVEGFEDVRGQQPGLSFYLDRLRTRSPYAFLKRTHGFWDRLVDLLEILPDYPWVTPKKGLRKHRGIDRLLRRLPPRELADPPWDEARERIRNFTLSDEMIEELASRSAFKTFWRGGFFEDLIRDIESPWCSLREHVAIHTGIPRTAETWYNSWNT